MLLFLFIISGSTFLHSCCQECRAFSKKMQEKTHEKKEESGRIFDLTTLHTISNYIRQKTRKERECFCAREEYLSRFSHLCSMMKMASSSSSSSSSMMMMMIKTTNNKINRNKTTKKRFRRRRRRVWRRRIGNQSSSKIRRRRGRILTQSEKKKPHRSFAHIYV